MIIATAGHVDHGKTLLVKALTGVDTDRLPEEKARSLTIDLGFAYRNVDGTTEPVGFIDVPGHERFIRNALCGLAGTDFVLFIVAADDGPMPQTREHLAILDLLGISHGAVALTKIDRVPADRIGEVTSEIEALFANTTLANAPVFPVSAMTGDGIAELQAHLDRAAREIPPRGRTGNFRLAIDRHFDVVGAGLVVTGTAFSGEIAAGTQAKLLGAGIPLRVRGIHAQNTASETGRAGQRCALNITGADLRKDLVARGDWIVSGAIPAPVRKLDAEVRVLRSEARPLKHWTPVHVHLGAAETTARLAVLGATQIDPGHRGLVQLVFSRPIGAVHGDRLIVRDQSARRTIGGGMVLDIFPPARGRVSAIRLAWLDSMRESDHKTALEHLLGLDAGSVDLEQFRANRNLTSDELSNVTGAIDAKIIRTADIHHAFTRKAWATIKDAILAALQDWHTQHPDTDGIDDIRALSAAGLRGYRKLASAITDRLVRDGKLQRTSAGVRLPGHKAKLSGADQPIWDAIEPAMAAAAPRPMTARELVEATGHQLKTIEAVLLRAGRQNLVTRISKTRYATPAQLEHLAEIAETLAVKRAGGLFSAADYRDASGIGRNVCIEVLEFFDQQRFTFRSGDGRKVLKTAHEAFGNRRSEKVR
jgi:selenocysteine-specific elongation factor